MEKILYNSTKHKGLKASMEKGMNAGIKKGEEEEKLIITCQMKTDHLLTNIITKHIDLSPEEIEKS